MREVSVTRLRLERFGAALVLGAVLSGPLAVEAHAQARVDANYVASLAGFTVGKGSWTIHLNGDSYVAAASGGTTGILRAFSSGSGTSAGRGKIDGTKALDAHYQATLDIAKKSDAIQIELLNGNVKAFSISPEPPADAERVPVTEAMRRSARAHLEAGVPVTRIGTMRAGAPRVAVEGPDGPLTLGRTSHVHF